MRPSLQIHWERAEMGPYCSLSSAWTQFLQASQNEAQLASLWPGLPPPARGCWQPSLQQPHTHCVYIPQPDRRAVGHYQPQRAGICPGYLPTKCLAVGFPSWG